MREIKFRFYSNVDKKMYNEMTIVGLQWQCDKDPNIYNADYVHDPDKWVQKYSDGHLMQYTGLKDKNGKEIYEGDKVICRKYIGGNFVDYAYEKGTVSFKDGAFYLLREQGYYRPLSWLIEFDYEIEVNGNIYENPDLLKEG